MEGLGDTCQQPLKGPTVALIFSFLAPTVLEVSEFVKDGVAKKEFGTY